MDCERYEGIVYLGKKLAIGVLEQHLLMMMAYDSSVASQLSCALIDGGYLTPESWEARKTNHGLVFVTDINGSEKAKELDAIEALCKPYRILVFRSGSKLEAELLTDALSEERILKLDPVMRTFAKVFFG